MTHHNGQRWTAVPSEVVTELVLSYRHDEAVLRRYFEKIDWGFSPDDCAIWIGALSDEGYGDFRLPGRTVRAHRVGWMWRFGPVPEETPFLDHAVTCIGRFCVNTLHLEPVDNAENQRRRTNRGAAEQRFLRSAELALRDERRARGEEYIF